MKQRLTNEKKFWVESRKNHFWWSCCWCRCWIKKRMRREVERERKRERNVAWENDQVLAEWRLLEAKIKLTKNVRKCLIKKPLIALFNFFEQYLIVKQEFYQRRHCRNRLFSTCFACPIRMPFFFSSFSVGTHAIFTKVINKIYSSQSASKWFWIV